MNKANRNAVALLITLLLIAPGLVSAQPESSALKTRNVILIVSDGLRWQEIFTGADPTLLNEKDGGIWDDVNRLRRDYWRDDVSERRRLLFPFLWGVVAKQGQIFGNQAKGSVARVTNRLAFSYPGYNEMLSGHPDPRINSNEFGVNPNSTVFEWLNRFPEFQGKVAVYGTWSVFADIFNQKRSGLVMQAGWDPPGKSSLKSRDLLDRLYRTTTRLDDDDVYDSFLQLPCNSRCWSMCSRATRASFLWDTARRTTGPTPAATTWCWRAPISLIFLAKNSGTRCNPCHSIAVKPLSLSRPTTGAEVARWNGRSTASITVDRKTSGSRCSVPTLQHWVSTPTSLR
jgi:hypothetical protein